MSFRTSLSDGSGLLAEGAYEDAPGEFDPLGSNAGLATPYVEQPPPDPEPGPLMPHYPIFDDSPGTVNGQTMGCVVDGVEQTYGCSSYARGLGTMFDVDFQRTDPFVLVGMGIFPYPTYNYRDVSPQDPDVDPENPERPITITTALVREFAGWGYHYSWAAPRQPVEPIRPPHPPQSPPIAPPDPCEGKKGSLNYDEPRPPDPNGQTTARGHITFNHIDAKTETHKSKYKSSILPNAALFTALTALNQLTFRFGTYHTDPRNGNYVYVYSIPEIHTGPPYSPIPADIYVQYHIGTDSTRQNQFTNVNTLVLRKGSCQIVVTSFPGLPGWLSPTKEMVWNPVVPSIRLYFL